jgi:serine protease Do
MTVWSASLALLLALAPACHTDSAASTAPAAAPAPAVPARPPAPAAPAGVAGRAALLDAIPDVSERAVRSVVNIATTKVVSTAAINPLAPFLMPGFPQAAPRQREQNSLGSGVIVDSEGVILTNNHVIEGADAIEVTLHDGRAFDAELVGTDARSDVAVLRLLEPPADLAPLPLGDADGLRLGEVVLAIGNPFGVGQTVTMGIVSAKGRGDLGITDYEDFIQTDAAINPGNSGGALVNLEGELVGVNTAIFSRSGGYQGIGFAIPIDMARDIMRDLLIDGEVARGWLGVLLQDLDDDLAQALELEEPRGVLVSDVTPGSPAERAGFERGDVVLTINGKTMDSTRRLRTAVATAGPGTAFTAEVVRDGERLTLSGELGTLADEEPEAVADSGPLEGLKVSPLDDGARAELDIPDRVRAGAVVRVVDEGSAAARAGLREGDVILEVNRRVTPNPDALRKALKRAGDRVLLLVWRESGAIYLVLSR